MSHEVVDDSWQMGRLLANKLPSLIFLGPRRFAIIRGPEPSHPQPGLASPFFPGVYLCASRPFVFTFPWLCLFLDRSFCAQRSLRQRRRKSCTSSPRNNTAHCPSVLYRIPMEISSARPSMVASITSAQYSSSLRKRTAAGPKRCFTVLPEEAMGGHLIRQWTRPEMSTGLDRALTAVVTASTSWRATRTDSEIGRAHV